MSSDRGLHAAAGQEVGADAYDRYIGRWSRLFVPSLLAAAEVGSGDRVLDVATGTGAPALMAISAVGHSGTVVGTDISPAMLEAARGRLSGLLRTVVADGQALAFRDASFDAVICQLGLMFFPDAARGLTEFRRVLRNGGCAAVCVISSADKAPMWGPLADALSRYLPDQREAFQLSFSLGDARRLKQMFAAAAFRDVRVMRETRDGIIRSFEEFWATIEAGTGQLPLVYLGLPEALRRAVREEVQAALSPFVSEGRLEMSVEMLIGKGRA
jgi:ubiquinone/menaquinone biosynthesis C-methylase UbiE